MFNHRENACIPLPPAPLHKRISASVQNARKTLRSWWIDLKRILSMCLSVMVGLFLCFCCVFVIMNAEPSEHTHSDRQYHRSTPRRSMFRASSIGFRSSRRTTFNSSSSRRSRSLRRR